MAVGSAAVRILGVLRRRRLGAAVCASLAGVFILAACDPVIDTSPPTTPTNMRVVSTGVQTISLAWNRSNDDIGVDHYMTYRDGKPVGTAPASPAPSYVDAGLWPHSTHTYYATASDAAGNTSRVTNMVTAFTQSDTTPPTAPTNLVAS